MDVLGWLAAVTLGRSPKARPWVGRAFIAIAVLGLLVGAWHMSLDFTRAGWGAIASAVGSLVAWRVLMQP